MLLLDGCRRVNRVDGWERVVQDEDERLWKRRRNVGGQREGKGIRTAWQLQNRLWCLCWGFTLSQNIWLCYHAASVQMKYESLFITSSYDTGNTHRTLTLYTNIDFFWLQIFGIDAHWMGGRAADSLRCLEDLVNELRLVPLVKLLTLSHYVVQRSG